MSHISHSKSEISEILLIFALEMFHHRSLVMKKNITSLLAFFIVWAFTAFMCYLLNLILDRNWLSSGWQEYIIIGFAGAVAGIFGPILAAWIGKLLKKRA